MRSVLIGVSLATIALTAGATPAKAAFINTVDRGWYRSDAFHNPGLDNHIAGFGNGFEYRNFFVFDLSGITNPLSSATLRVNTESVTAVGTFTLFDVSTPIASLAGGTGGVAAFNDLGTGITLATYNASPSSSYQFVTISLNTDALAYLNDHLGGTVALGGRFFGNGYMFGGSGGSTLTQLEYQINPVPAPGSGTLLGFGLTSLAGFRAVRRKTRAVVIA